MRFLIYSHSTIKFKYLLDCYILVSFVYTILEKLDLSKCNERMTYPYLAFNSRSVMKRKKNLRICGMFNNVVHSRSIKRIYIPLP